MATNLFGKHAFSKQSDGRKQSARNTRRECARWIESSFEQRGWEHGIQVVETLLASVSGPNQPHTEPRIPDHWEALSLKYPGKQPLNSCSLPSLAVKIGIFAPVLVTPVNSESSPSRTVIYASPAAPIPIWRVARASATVKHRISTLPPNRSSSKTCIKTPHDPIDRC